MRTILTVTAGAMLMAALGCANPCSRSRTAGYSQCAPVTSGCAPVDSCGTVMGAPSGPIMTGPSTPGVITPTPEYYTPTPR